MGNTQIARKKGEREIGESDKKRRGMKYGRREEKSKRMGNYQVPSKYNFRQSYPIYKFPPLFYFFEMETLIHNEPLFSLLSSLYLFQMHPMRGYRGGGKCPPQFY
uniref:Uncharacterized protein n=1 Tax=Cacopsylla melanoneura TaxID=428564 RepID=A0A8D8ZCL0_9HEMI